MVISGFKKVLLFICIVIIVMWAYSFIPLYKSNKHNNLNDAYIMCEILERLPNIQSLLLLGHFHDSIMPIIIYDLDSTNLSFLTTLSVPGREFRIEALVCKVAYYDSILHSISFVDNSIIGLNDKLYAAMVMNSVAKFYFWKENSDMYYLCYDGYYMPFWFKRKIVLSTDEKQGINLQVNKVANTILSKVLYYINLPLLSLLSNKSGGTNIEKHIICGKLYSVNKEKIVYIYMPCDSILKDTIDGAKFIYIDLVPKDSLLFLYHFKGLFAIDDFFETLIDIKDAKQTVFIPHEYMVNLKYPYKSWMKITRATDSKYEVCILYNLSNDSIYIILPLL